MRRNDPQPIAQNMDAVMTLITVFRRWRSGTITTDDLLARLDDDDLATVLDVHYQEQR